MAHHLRYLAHSENGLVRKNNQDSGYASPTMIVVADGMGGAAAGDLASAVAILELARADGNYRGEDMLTIMAGAVNRANDRIADLIENDNDLDGMGTTVCGAMFDGEHLGVTHIGDSRGYLLRNGELSRLTHDHSWVQTLIDEGKITEDEASYHPHRNLVLKVVNGVPSNQPDLALVSVEAGDRIMFCSDGLCGLVDDAELLRILSSDADDLVPVMTDLVDAAHHGGGLDNITIVLADVTTEEVAGMEPVILGAVASVEVPDTPTLPHPIMEDTTPLQRLGSVRGGDELAEAGRYAPTTRRPRFRLLKASLIIVALLAVLGGVLGGLYGYSRSQFYVGAADTRVAIFRGLPDSVLGVPMHEVYELEPTQLSDLPPYYQEQVRGTIEVDSLQAARETVAELKTRADRCVDQRRKRAEATTAPTTTPSASPSASPSGTPRPASTNTPAAPPAPEEC